MNGYAKSILGTVGIVALTVLGGQWYDSDYAGARKDRAEFRALQIAVAAEPAGPAAELPCLHSAVVERNAKSYAIECPHRLHVLAVRHNEIANVRVMTATCTCKDETP